MAKRLRNKPVLFHIFIVGLIAHELGHIFWTDFEDNDRVVIKAYGKMLKTIDFNPEGFFNVIRRKIIMKGSFYENS